MLGGTFHRGICHGGKISMKGAQDLLALLKKMNIKKFFFQLEVRSSIKT